MVMFEERYLVWRLKRGSAQALCRIYNRYEGDLLTLATNLLGRTGQAEDVLQDVFVKFIESIDTFELTGSLPARRLPTLPASRKSHSGFAGITLTKPPVEHAVIEACP